MKKESIDSVLMEEIVVNRIFLVRGIKVMLDFDLSEMYGVENKQLKRQVRRNIERFPPDFMFELTNVEWENLRRQFGSSSWGGSRYLPLAFTEQGVAMISSVLRSKTAIEVNIVIIRIFSKMREMLLNYKDVLLKLEQLEKQVVENSNDIQMIFSALKELLKHPSEPRERIGFRRQNETK